MNKFSHYTDDGSSRMVDISEKGITERIAKAIGFVKMDQKTIQMIKERLIPKGNVFEVARVAGIVAAKRTFEMHINFTHSMRISQ